MNSTSFKVISHKDDVKRLSQSSIKFALEEIGIACEGFAKLKCPVDTGNLRDSITHEVLENYNTVIIGTPVQYASVVELGTSDKKRKPTHYLRSALTEHNITYQTIVNKYLKDS